MGISIKGLNKDYFSEGKRIRALADVDLTIPARQIFTLLGPSGCGKNHSAQVYCWIGNAGLGRNSDRGRNSLVKGKGHLCPSGKTGLNMVFQTYAIWPHMNVFDNVAYPLQTRKEPKKDNHKKSQKDFAICAA